MSLLNVIAGEKRVDDGVELRTIVAIGKMGSGKSTMAVHLVARAYRHLVQRGVQDDEVLALHFNRTSIPFILEYLKEFYELENLKYLYLINDDASYASISRRSLSNVNVESARQYIVIRHRLRKMGFNGVLVVFHLTQLYYLLDKVLRDGDVLAFKTLSRDPVERDTLAKILWGNMLKVLETITEKIQHGSREEFNEAIRYAVVLVGNRERILYKVVKERPPSSVYHVIDEEEIENFVESRVGFTWKELGTMLRACGFRFDNSKLKTFVDVLNSSIARKFAGDFDLNSVLSEVEEVVR